MPIAFITGNKNKFSEAQAVLPDLVMRDIDLPEIQELDPRMIIEAKLTSAEAREHGAYVVEDTSLSIACLGGLPGPLIKWFLQGLGADGLATVALTLDEHPRAQATCMLGYKTLDGTSSFFEATQHGTIVQPRGDHAFGWDSIFVPDGHTRTYAEMPPEEKRAISMRAQAFCALRDHLDRNR